MQEITDMRIPLTREALLKLSAMLSDLAACDKAEAAVTMSKIQTSHGEFNIHFFCSELITLRSLEIGVQNNEQN